MGLYKPPRPALQQQKYSPDRTSDYLAGAWSPQRVHQREQKRSRREREDSALINYLAYSISATTGHDAVVQAALAASFTNMGQVRRQRIVYGAVKLVLDRQKQTGEPAPENFYEKVKDFAEKAGTAGAASLLLLTLGQNFLPHDHSGGAAAESGSDYEKQGKGRAADGWGPLAQNYQDLDSEMDSALADGQLSVQERGKLQEKISALQARQTQALLDYLDGLVVLQRYEGENVSVLKNYTGRAIDWSGNNPREWDQAALNLRDQILPARDSNLQGAGVDKSAANYTTPNGIAERMKEMARAHQENDAAVQKMVDTQNVPTPDKFSDIGTSPEKTSAPLSKLMKQFYDADPTDKDTLLEFLSGWLEAPDTWDFANGVWEENPVEVLRAVRDFYNAKIAPAPYFTAVSDWTPVEKPINRAPVIDESSIVSEGTVKHGFADDVNATDLDGDPLTHRIISGPTGMEINPETGEISWMPTVGQIGDNRVVLGVSDGKEETTYEWTIRIASGNAKPVIDPSSVSTEGSTRYGYDSSVNASDADRDALTYRIARGPSGMGIDSRTGRINWLPNQNQMGQYEVVVGVSDGMDEAQYSWIVEITNGNHAPIINDQDLVKVGQTRHTYAQRIIAFDPDNELDPQNPDPLIYKLINAPAGMEIDPNIGWITWNPNRTQTGRHNVTVEVGDGEKATRLTYQLEVSSDNKAPRILSTPQALVKVGSRWEPAVGAEDPDNDPLSYELELNGFKANSSSGDLSWAPAKGDIGQKSYTIRVKDPYGGVAEQKGNLTVVPNNPPQAPSIQKIFLEKGRAARVSISGIDADGDSLAYRIVSAEAGVNAEIDESGNLVLKGLKKISGKVRLAISDGADEIEFDVPYEVKEKVIAPNMLPAYLAAGVLIAGAGAAGTYGAYRVDRRVKVNQVIALDGPGRRVGSWDERGKLVSDDSGDEMLTGAMLTAVRSFVKDGLKGEINTFDYTLPVTGRPKVKFVIEGNNNLTIAAVVGTENPKRIRRVSRALREALKEGSPAIIGWEGGKTSPKVYAVGSAVQRNVYGRELKFFEWLKELAGIDSRMETEEYKVPVITAPSIPAPVLGPPVLAGTGFGESKKALPLKIVQRSYQPPPARKPPAFVSPKPGMTRERKKEILSAAIISSNTPEEAVRKIAAGLGAVGRESEIRRTLPDEEFYRLKGVPAPAEKRVTSVAPPDDSGRALLDRITSSLPKPAEPSQRSEARNLKRIIERSLTYGDAVAELSKLSGKPPEHVRGIFSKEFYNEAKTAYPTGLSAHETDSGVRAGETVIDPKDIRKRPLSADIDPTSPLGRLLSRNNGGG